ncbi:MAG: hypothetical protein ACLPQS_02395 [Acidimicrobiales bacterium]
MQLASFRSVATAAATLLIAIVGFSALAVDVGSPAASAAVARASSSAAASASGYVPYVLPNGDIPQPPWWHGKCDGAKDGTFPGSYPLGASWDGLIACGPGSNEGASSQPEVQFFPDAWGEFEWQCVELSMRWMYLAWGIPPYAANGNEVVDNYAAYNPDGPKLIVVKNGTPGAAPQPGDVLELTDSDSNGHTEVVTDSQVNAHGNGTVRVITENLNSPTDGWYTLTVSKWVVNGGFGTVVDWLHNPRWALQEPLISELDASGNLLLKIDALRGGFTAIASGVARADVIGGGGSEPAPIIVVLTTSGTVEARYDLPDAPWWQLGSGATQIAATSGEGRNGEPSVGWLTSGGDFFVVTGGLSAKPVLEATGAASIALASDSPSQNLLMGYVTDSSGAYLKIGSAPAVRVAVGVRTLSLADDGGSAARAVEAYVGVGGRAFLRIGITGHFTEIGPTAKDSVSQVAVATVGKSSTPLVAYLTTDGDAYTDLGDSGWLHALSAAESIAVAAGHNKSAFPIFAAEESDGSWVVKDGSLSSRYVNEGTEPSLSLGALVVS